MSATAGTLTGKAAPTLEGTMGSTLHNHPNEGRSARRTEHKPTPVRLTERGWLAAAVLALAFLLGLLALAGGIEAGTL